MDERLRLSALLHEILGSDNVYYQPPESISMKYPAIIYARDGISNTFADDIAYIHRIKYRITVIDKDPDSIIVDKISRLPMCSFDRHYTADNLNHDVFTITI